METRGPQFALATKPQLAELKDPDDDWTGLRNAVERRKRQNRLNVRAHRRRKEQQLQSRLANGIASQPVQQQPIAPGLRPNWKNSPSSDEYWDAVDIYQLIFPLPIDHRLLILIQYNVLRGIATNVNILSLHHLITMDCRKAHGNMILFPTPTNVPESLKPTVLQKSTPHEEWIDLMPCPKMRDNAIMLEGTFDNDDLCCDLVGGLYEGVGDGGIEENGMLVWSDPWDVRGWELTEGFVRKWGFLLRGCREMIEATNMWRSMRAEEPLVIEL